VAPYLTPAPGGDEGVEAVGAEVVEQLDHRLIDEVGVKDLEAWMLGDGQPVLDLLVEIRSGQPGRGRLHDLDHPLLARGGEPLEVALQDRGKGLLRLPF